MKGEEGQRERERERNGNDEKRQGMISIDSTAERAHAVRACTHAGSRSCVRGCVCALRFIAEAPLTGGLRPSKGCACSYVHNTIPGASTYARRPVDASKSALAAGA